MSAEVFQSLVKAQAEMPFPSFDKEVSYGGAKKFKYASLTQILKVCRPVLAKHSLCIVQKVHQDRVETQVVHATGDAVGCDVHFRLPLDANMQALGSAITYAKRYGICALLGIAADDDDDGELASETKRTEAITHVGTLSKTHTEIYAQLATLIGQGKVAVDQMKQFTIANYGTDDSKKLTETQLKKVLDHFIGHRAAH